jgi:hypothetical protein
MQRHNSTKVLRILTYCIVSQCSHTSILIMTNIHYSQRNFMRLSSETDCDNKLHRNLHIVAFEDSMQWNYQLIHKTTLMYTRYIMLLNNKLRVLMRHPSVVSVVKLIRQLWAGHFTWCNLQNLCHTNCCLFLIYRGADRSLARPTSLSIVFSVQGRGGSPTGPDPENRVGNQDIWSPGRPVSSGLQMPGETFPSWPG